MKKLFLVLALITAAACTSVPAKSVALSKSQPTADQNEAEILFLVRFEDGSKFDENEVLTVSLYDGGLMDTAMQPIAVFTETTDKPFGPRAHIAGRFSYKKADFAKLSMPSFSARLEKDGRLIAINMSSQRYSGKTLAETIIINRVN